jgi:hypothetical protein
MPNFREFADVVRRAGIYGPRDYLKIVEEQIRFWGIATLTGLNDVGRAAQEKIMAFPSGSSASRTSWRRRPAEDVLVRGGLQPRVRAD